MSYPGYDRYHHHHRHQHSLPSSPRQRPSDSAPPRRSFEYGSGPINIMPPRANRTVSTASYHLSPQFYSHAPLASSTTQNPHAHAHFEPYSQLQSPSLSSSPQQYYQPQQSPQLRQQSLHPSSAAVSPMPLVASRPGSGSGSRSRSSSQASGLERHSGESRRSRGSSRSGHSPRDRPHHHHHRHSHQHEGRTDSLERAIEDVNHRPTLGGSLYSAWNGLRRFVSARRD